MRVLHVITGLAAGGAERQLRMLLTHQRCSAEVATLTNPGQLARELRADGLTVHEVGMRSNVDLMAVPRLARLIRSGGFDLVHTHLFRAGIYGRLAARLAGVRHVVATEHSLGRTSIEGRRLTPWIRALYLASERLGDATIAVSGAVAAQLADWGVQRSRITVIPNGIESDDFTFSRDRRIAVRASLGIPADCFVVGSVCRLVPGKRVDVVLRSACDLAGVTVLIAGDGPESRALGALARSLGVPAVFAGESADVPGLLSAMDLLVMPSTAETFGVAVIEALAAGLPVLYTTCPALDDLPPGSVPGARRLAPDVRAFGREIAAAIHQGPQRLPPPSALEHYDMAQLAARVDALYARVTGMADRRVLADQRRRDR